MKWNTLDVEPRFYEIDSYSIVNNMYYLAWLEMARLKVAKDAGLLIPRLYSESIMFVVGEARIQYLNAVNFWDRVRVETVITKVEGSRMDFDHRIHSSITRNLMSTATTTIVCLRAGQVIPALPEWVKNKLDAYLQDVQGGTPQ